MIFSEINDYDIQAMNPTVNVLVKFAANLALSILIIYSCYDNLSSEVMNIMKWVDDNQIVFKLDKA